MTQTLDPQTVARSIALDKDGVNALADAMPPKTELDVEGFAEASKADRQLVYQIAWTVDFDRRSAYDEMVRHFRGFVFDANAMNHGIADHTDILWRVRRTMEDAARYAGSYVEAEERFRRSSQLLAGILQSLWNVGHRDAPEGEEPVFEYDDWVRPVVK